MGLAPLAPEAGLSVGLILLAIACVTLLALNRVYKLTIGALVSTLASMFDSIRTPKLPVVGSFSLSFIGDALRSVDNYVLQAIGTGIQETERGLHAVIGAMTWLLQETADQVAGLAGDTAQAFGYFKAHLIPAQIRAAVGWVKSEVIHLANQVAHLAAHPVTAVHTTTRVIAPGLKALEGKVASLEGKVASLATAGAAANPVPIIERIGSAAPAIPGDIYRGIDSLWKDVRRFGRTLTPAGIAGLVAAAVGSLGIGWGRCANSQKFGKSVCGMNQDLLDALLASLLVVASTISVVEFSHACQDFTAEVTDPLRLFVRELHDAKLPTAPSFVSDLERYAAGIY